MRVVRQRIEEKISLTMTRQMLRQLRKPLIIVPVPVLSPGLSAGWLRMHGWVYFIESGQVTAYDPGEGRFQPLVRAAAALQPATAAQPATA